MPPAVGLPDISTFLYILLLLATLALARATPWAGARLPDSLVSAEDDASYAALYFFAVSVISVLYLPAAVGLAKRGGGSPAALLVAVLVHCLATAPIEDAFRTRHDASVLARRVVATLALGAWFAALTNGWLALLGASLALVLGIALANVHGARFAVEALAFTALHLGLALEADLTKRASALRFRLLAPLVVVPLVVAVGTPLFLAAGHAWFGMVDRPVNHAGLPVCAYRHAEV